MCIVCGFVAAWPLPPFSLNALHWLDIYNLLGCGFVPCVPLCPAFLGRVFGPICLSQNPCVCGVFASALSVGLVGRPPFGFGPVLR